MPDDPAPNENATGTPLASGSGTPVASLSGTPLASVSGTPLASHGDDATTVAELRKLIADFVDERDWRQYHSPKNISMALAIEAAELMEHFQWLDQQASRLVVANEQQLQAVGEELADVIGYSMAMANELGIDIAATMRAKMEKNREKYPVDEFKGDRFRGRLSSDG